MSEIYYLPFRRLSPRCQCAFLCPLESCSLTDKLQLDRPSLLEALEAVDHIYQADSCSQKMILALVNRGLADGGVSIRDLISLLTVSYFSTPFSF
jgi:hypothetical protein